MLVLNRKIGESIIIDGDIEVILLDRKGKQVRLGVKAPDQVSVNRKEIQIKKDEKERDDG